MGKKTKTKKKQLTPIHQFLKSLQTLDIQDGNLTDIDAFALIQLAKSIAEKTPQPLKFLEVGPWKGKSTACLALVASKYPNSLIFSIDTFQGTPNTKEEQIAKTVDIMSIFRHNMKTINASNLVGLLNLSIRQAALILREGSFDLVFLDGSNFYLDVQEAIDYALNWVRVGGIICGRNLSNEKYESIQELVEKHIEFQYDKEHKLHPGINKAVYEAFEGNHTLIKGSSIWFYKRIK